MQECRHLLEETMGHGVWKELYWASWPKAGAASWREMGDASVNGAATTELF